MTEEFKGVKFLEIGKDYINESGKRIIIDRKGNSSNNGFRADDFAGNIVCQHPRFWREASEQEIIEAFTRHLIYRYGADWETMKIKEKHPDATSNENDGLFRVMISKFEYGWGVYNKNGLLYYKGIWVEKLEPEVNSLGVNLKAWDELVKDAPQSTFGQKSALKEQIGGEHYKNFEIQPIEFIHKNGLSFIQGNIIKYVCRYKSKGGIEDLQKAKHCIDLLIEFEEEPEKERK